MARTLGFGGLANTNGTRSFAGKAEAEDESGQLHFRSNDFNRRRYGGLWALILLTLMRAYG